jgi:hypothetical protein
MSFVPGPDKLRNHLSEEARRGATVDLSDWASREVDAELLRALLTDASTPGPQAVKLRRARIVGQLDLIARELRCPLWLRECCFTEPILLSETTATSIRLIDCRLVSLKADQLRTRGDLDLSGIRSTEEVCVRGARIGGGLTFEGARLKKGSGRWAVDAEGLRVEQNTFLRALVAEGGVEMSRARIGGQLNLDDATLTSRKTALRGDRLRVEEGMFCRSNRSNFSAKGEVRLPRAQIGGQLSFRHATLANPGGAALYARGLSVEQNMRCDDGFSTTGSVSLLGAQIGGKLTFEGARLGDSALDLESVGARELDLRFGVMPEGITRLTDARVGRLRDRQYGPDKRWAVCQLEGCRYEALDASPEVSAKDRLAWLAASPPPFSPQPYEQLAVVYRAHGNESAARRVAIKKQQRQREKLPWLAKVWSLFLGATVGHGYRLWFAGVWLLLLVAIGSVIFGRLFDAGVRASDDLIPARTGPVPDFHSLIYTVDVLVPVLNLGEEAAWNARGAAQWIAFALALIGWLLTSAFVAGVAVRRQ